MTKARISDAAVLTKTGKNWEQWFTILDEAGAMKMSHKHMAEYLYDKLWVPGWWCQMIAVTYEQERGLREKFLKPDGYTVSAGKVVAVPVGNMYEHWNDKNLRSKWLDFKLIIRKATPNKLMRGMWTDGKTRVDAYFYEKARSKSQVSVQHTRLANSKQAESMKSYWKAALERLASVL
jgi:hypothetical protein